MKKIITAILLIASIMFASCDSTPEVGVYYHVGRPCFGTFDYESYLEMDRRSKDMDEYHIKKMIDQDRVVIVNPDDYLKFIKVGGKKVYVFEWLNDTIIMGNHHPYKKAKYQFKD